VIIYIDDTESSSPPDTDGDSLICCCDCVTWRYRWRLWILRLRLRLVVLRNNLSEFDSFTMNDRHFLITAHCRRVVREMLKERPALLAVLQNYMESIDPFLVVG